jgi:hypothetical protein
MRKLLKVLLGIWLVTVGFVLGAGMIVEWPSVIALRADATRIAIDGTAAVATIAAVEVEQTRDAQDWGRWQMERDGLQIAVTAAAMEGTVSTGRLLGLTLSTPIPGAVVTPAIDIALADPLAGPGLSALGRPPANDLTIIASGGNWNGWNAYVIGNGYPEPLTITSLEVAYSRYGSDQIVTTSATFLVPYVVPAGGYGIAVTYSAETARLFSEGRAVSYGGSFGFHRERPEDWEQRFVTANVVPVGNGLAGTVFNAGTTRYTGKLTGRGICVDAGGAVVGAVVGELQVDLAAGEGTSFTLAPVREVVCDRFIVGFTTHAP